MFKGWTNLEVELKVGSKSYLKGGLLEIKVGDLLSVIVAILKELTLEVAVAHVVLNKEEVFDLNTYRGEIDGLTILDSWRVRL